MQHDPRRSWLRPAIQFAALRRAFPKADVHVGSDGPDAHLRSLVQKILRNANPPDFRNPREVGGEAAFRPTSQRLVEPEGLDQQSMDRLLAIAGKPIVEIIRQGDPQRVAGIQEREPMHRLAVNQSAV